MTPREQSDLAGRDFLSPAEFGARVGKDRKTIQAWISKGHLQSVRVEQSRLIPVSELERLKRRASRG